MAHNICTKIACRISHIGIWILQKPVKLVTGEVIEELVVSRLPHKPFDVPKHNVNCLKINWSVL
jgi:hypothetical protein